MTDPKVQAKHQRQARMLADRCVKKFKHLRKRMTKQNIEVFRIYDWDIPEIRAVVDWYAGHLVIGEYVRTQSTPEWLPLMGEAVGAALDVAPEKIHLKKRVYGKKDGMRYQRLDTTNQLIEVCERDLKFYVNPWDYVDTGLFGDHRDTRQMVREMAAGKEFLNLFCYTGAFTCYAAKGGARLSVSVDRSKTAIQWARRNLELNHLPAASHRLIQSHIWEYLAQAQKKEQRFDLAVVDPPSFYTLRSSGDHFDIVADHPALLSATGHLMRPGATIFFSTNHQDFSPRMEELPFSRIEEITAATMPEDYQHKRKTIHRCWRITV
ncbi:MAG: class I SAM-dependent methyltransferase [Desulfobacteraceae bacterium]|nr:class I SAM-dependent methyltransferase [Desulfobacteraceae bacterium]